MSANKKVVIIGGGTFSHVRAHLALATPAFGETAKQLAEMCKEQFTNMDVELILTKMADSKSSIVTNDNVYDFIRDKVVFDYHTKVVFFNAAMTDFVGTIDDEPPSKFGPRLESKFQYNMTLTAADKVIGKIRNDWYDFNPEVMEFVKKQNARKDIFLVGFKTTTNASKEEMFKKGLNLCKKASCNLVLVNDIATRVNMIVTPEEGVYEFDYPDGREDALRNLVKMAWHRTHLTFTRSTVVDGQPVAWNDAKVYPVLRDVVDWCVAKNAYKEFNGVTTGHFAAKIGEREFLTSIRKTNFNDIAKNGMVRVTTDGNDSIIAYGAKPSVGGQSQRIIFDNFLESDCIVHFHCPLKTNHRDDINVTPQWPRECGSFECGVATAQGLKQHGNLYAIMLDNHGPNIVFNHNVSKEEVIDFINANFDLSQHTSGYL